MTRILLVLVAFATGLAFTAAVPAAALAGLDTVPAATQPGAAAACAETEGDWAADFVVVICKKKAQPVGTTFCQQFQVVMPDAAPGRSRRFAHTVPDCGAMHVAIAEPEAPTDPPRG